MVKRPRVRERWAIWIVVLFVLAVILGLSFFINFKKRMQHEKEHSLPEINILLNGVSLEEINAGDKRIKYEGNTLVLGQGGEKMEIDDVEFKGRGNMSWLIDKKSYRVKFPEKIDILSQSKSKKIALISNHLDDTFLRNDLAHFIARLVDEKHPINGDFADLYIDGEYIGLYYLVQPVDINKNVIDLRNPMGLIVEVDNAYCWEEEAQWITNTMKDCLTMKDIVEEDDGNIARTINSFLSTYDMFEQSVLVGDFEEASKYVDRDSWVGHYLVGEFAVNLDTAITSMKLYQDGPSDKIHAVLAWDFDWSFGNKNWDDARNPRVLMARYKMLHPEKPNYVSVGGDCRFDMNANSEDYVAFLSQTICYLVDMPEFRERVVELYREKIRPKKGDIIEYIKHRAEYIRKSAIRDNEKWNKRNFDEEVEYLIWWINERFDYFDRISSNGFADIGNEIDGV